MAFEGNELAAGNGPRVPDDWFVDFHRGLAARFWRAAAATMTHEDMQLVLPLLKLPDGGRVLDAPCGDGRLTVALAAAGYQAVGVDVAVEELERGRTAAEAATVPATFMEGDLRTLPVVKPVDAVLSWGNSFGYLAPGDTVRALGGMRWALRPGGRLVLESHTVAESLLVAGVRPRTEHEFGGVRMTARNHYRVAESRLETDYVFEDQAGSIERARGAHHVHTAGELVRLLHAAGFAEVALLAGDAATPYELGAPRLIAVATT